MKLEIPKAVADTDVAHADIIPAEPEGRNPDFTNDTYLPNVGGNEALVWPIGPAEADNVNEHEIKRLIIDDCRSAGLVSGAVVVHQRLPLGQRLAPGNWGFVIRANGLSETSADVNWKWKPLCVRWATGSYEDCSQTDLCLLMTVPDKFILKARASRDTTPSRLPTIY